MHITDRQEKKLRAVSLVLLLSLAIAAALPMLNIQGIRKEVVSSPIPNTARDVDGVIRLIPEKGCGPLAHVENHPKYGRLCVQEGRWQVSTSNAAATEAPCIGPDEALLLSCLPSLHERVAAQKAALNRPVNIDVKPLDYEALRRAGMLPN